MIQKGVRRHKKEVLVMNKELNWFRKLLKTLSTDPWYEQFPVTEQMKKLGIGWVRG